MQCSQPAARCLYRPVWGQTIHSHPISWRYILVLFSHPHLGLEGCRMRLKCDGTRAETRFRLSAKRTSPFKSAGASVRSTAGSRGVRISGSNAGYTMFRGSVKGTVYPLISPVLPFTSPPMRHRVPSHFSWTLHYFMFPPPKPNFITDNSCIESR